MQANLSAKRYAAALELARKARAQNADDLRFARLEAQALRQSGKNDEAVSLLQDYVRQQPDKPESYVALAQIYIDTKRGADAVRMLQDAQQKFPADTTIPFELGAVLDKQKRFADAESAFRQVLSKDPDHAPALNYLGYMFAERGERLDESVTLLKKALTIEPDNGSYLDSLGWAYYKADKLDLAVTNLERAAEQLQTNSVIQDHYGDVLFKLSRYDDAIAAWNRAIGGDGDSIDRAGIDKKIKSAKQKLGREMTRRSAAPLLALSLVCAACGPPLVKLPSGPGVIASDGAEALDAATAVCRPLSTVSLEVAVSGSIAGSRVRGRLIAGLTRAGAVRLEAVAPVGQPVFVLTNGIGSVQPGATLLLPRDNRVLQRGQFDAVLEAVTGIPLDAPVLFSVLTGCTPGTPSEATRSATIGASCRSRRRNGTRSTCTAKRTDPGGWWRRRAAAADSGWRAEYGNFQEGCHGASG